MGSIELPENMWQSCRIQIPKSEQFALCRWRLKAAELAAKPVSVSAFNIVDLIFTIAPQNGCTTENVETIDESWRLNDNDSPTSMKFILSHLVSQFEGLPFEGLAMKLIVPNESGFVVSSNILQQRMLGCEHVSIAEDFVSPFTELRSQSPFSGSVDNFKQLVYGASGGLLIQREVGTSIAEILDVVDTQLTNRMSIPWIQPVPPKKHVLVAIGRHRTQSMETFYEAAKSLGIQLLLIDSEDLETTYHCRDEFMYVDMTLDDDLPGRIAEAIERYPGIITGVVAYRDHLLVTAAKVAESIALPGLPPASVRMCVNKYEMRMRDLSNCPQVLHASSLQHLQSQIASLSEPLQFPLVVKPSSGQGSVGVSKATSFPSLFAAVSAIEQYGASTGQIPGVIIESYIDGPEIDANFALLDGEILFAEVVDNFPCTADEQGARATDSFLERDMVYPSGLPESEIMMIKTDIQHLLVDDLGFRTGVFHVEGRVCRSSVQYVEENGITDLRPRKHSQEERKSPSLFILEVNARCPGVAGVYPTAYTYGIDFALLWLLAAIGDSARLHALSQPFLNGPQCWTDLVPITVTRGGTLDSDDILTELRNRMPALMEHVTSEVYFYHKGDVIPEPSVTNLAGIIVEFVCSSKKSRADLLEVVRQIREEVRIEWK